MAEYDIGDLRNNVDELIETMGGIFADNVVPEVGIDACCQNVMSDVFDPLLRLARDLTGIVTRKVDQELLGYAIQASEDALGEQLDQGIGYLMVHVTPDGDYNTSIVPPREVLGLKEISRFKDLLTHAGEMLSEEYGGPSMPRYIPKAAEFKHMVPETVEESPYFTQIIPVPVSGTLPTDIFTVACSDLYLSGVTSFPGGDPRVQESLRLHQLEDLTFGGESLDARIIVDAPLRTVRGEVLANGFAKVPEILSLVNLEPTRR